MHTNAPVDSNIAFTFTFAIVYTFLVIRHITYYRFSGLTAQDLIAVTTRLQDVQQDLLKLFYEDTILLGHSLESDLLSLKVHNYSIIPQSVTPFLTSLIKLTK